MKCVHVIKGMSFHAFHGVLEVERELGQVLLVDAAAEFDVDASGDSSKTEPVVRDANVYEITRNVITETKYRSMGCLAGKIALDILAAYLELTAVKVSITKRQLFIAGNVHSGITEVVCTRADFDAMSKKG